MGIQLGFMYDIFFENTLKGVGLTLYLRYCSRFFAPVEFWNKTLTSLINSNAFQSLARCKSFQAHSGSRFLLIGKNNCEIFTCAIYADLIINSLLGFQLGTRFFKLVNCGNRNIQIMNCDVVMIKLLT